MLTKLPCEGAASSGMLSLLVSLGSSFSLMNPYLFRPLFYLEKAPRGSEQKVRCPKKSLFNEFLQISALLVVGDDGMGLNHVAEENVLKLIAFLAGVFLIDVRNLVFL